jgi:tetratricopeptide (TPR) repeat protein
MGRSAVTLALVLAAAPSGRAAAPLDPEADRPYRWRVAVRVDPHPALGQGFRDRLTRELAAVAGAYLGTAGTAEVIDLAAPPGPLDGLCEQFLLRGFAAIDDPPANAAKNPADPARVLSPVKTHFVTVEYRAGVFHLAARQHDGFTGIASPVTRRQSTRVADMVPRLAGLLLEPDFAPVGTVVPDPDDPGHVTVVLRGTAAGPVERWVAAGDVFAVSVVEDVPAPLPPGAKADRKAPAQTVRVGGLFRYTLLRATAGPQGGRVPCVVLTRYQPEFAFGRAVARKRAAGVRCLRLPTVESVVALRVVDQNGVPHARGSQLRVSGTDVDFRTRPGPDDVFTLHGGAFRSPRPFNNVACVLVALGEDPPQQFPVPVLGDEPVTVNFDLKPEDERRAEFASTCRDLQRQVAPVVDAQLALFKNVYRLIDARQVRAALAEAEQGYARIAAEQQRLAEELKAVRADPAAADPGAKRLLDACEVQLAEVRAGQETFAKRLEDLKKAAAASNTPEQLDKDFRAKELAERIKELKARGDIPEALEVYAQLIALMPDQQQFKDEREKLQAEWAPKDEEHRKAREAVQTWQQAKTVEEFQAAVKGLEPAVEVMLRKRDRLGLGKLVNTFTAAEATLSGLVANTDGTSEDGAKELKELQKIDAAARSAQEKAREALKKLS